jgi:hypothetical protein
LEVTKSGAGASTTGVDLMRVLFQGQWIKTIMTTRIRSRMLPDVLDVTTTTTKTDRAQVGAASPQLAAVFLTIDVRLHTVPSPRGLPTQGGHVLCSGAWYQIHSYALAGNLNTTRSRICLRNPLQIRQFHLASTQNHGRHNISDEVPEERKKRSKA